MRKLPVGASSSFTVPASAESPPGAVIAMHASSALRAKQEVLLPGRMIERSSLDRIIVMKPGYRGWGAAWLLSLRPNICRFQHGFPFCGLCAQESLEVL